jgi:hypothetical protein
VPNGIATATTSGKDEGKLSANGNAAQMKKGSAALSNGTTTHAPAAVPQAGLGQDGLPDVRIPLKTVEEGVEFLKARVRDVVEVVEPEVLEEGGISDEEWNSKEQDNKFFYEATAWPKKNGTRSLNGM